MRNLYFIWTLALGFLPTVTESDSGPCSGDSLNVSDTFSQSVESEESKVGNPEQRTSSASEDVILRIGLNWQIVYRLGGEIVIRYVDPYAEAPDTLNQPNEPDSTASGSPSAEDEGASNTQKIVTD